MKRLSIWLLLFWPLLLHLQRGQCQTQVLNGSWWYATTSQRQYATSVTVPGIQTDASKATKTTHWFMRQIAVQAPQHATLTLQGARFAPAVYINGKLVGQAEGGMAPIKFFIPARFWKADTLNTLEVRLLGLDLLPDGDASKIPIADRWRSNIGACLWDDVVLKWHRPVTSASIDRLVPSADSGFKQLQLGIGLHYWNEGAGTHRAQISLINKQGKVVAGGNYQIIGSQGTLHQAQLKLATGLIRWAPDRPYLYRLKVSIFDAQNQLQDEVTVPYGLKYVGTENSKQRKGFVLNNRPWNARMISTVWHRWVRDPEGRVMAYNDNWFKTNILQRTKDIGGNTIRFHLGVPPERYLNWCDSMGLAVQLEWLFFHGIKADEASMQQQWRQWLDLAARHPSVVFIHPWNETEGEELKRGWRALNSLLPEYGRLLIAERDQWHIHKYWWGLFENLGLYYDDVRQFPTPIVADEFGGNYLDGEHQPGGYKTLQESFLRFLGPYHSGKQRLAHHTMANARIAEYWRSIGAGGYSPFCALSSWEDGNHWFVGKLQAGKPKPVWQALTPAYSPVAASLMLWDRHFEPSTRIKVPVHLYNDKYFPHQAIWQVQVVNQKGKIIYRIDHSQLLGARTHRIEQIDLLTPLQPGHYTLKAWLKNPPKEVRYPVVSSWPIRVIAPKVPIASRSIKLYIPPQEKELLAFAKQYNLNLTADPKLAQVALLGLNSWHQRISQPLVPWQEVPRQIWLQVGPQWLGKSYPKKDNLPADSLGPWQAGAVVTNPADSTYQLIKGLQIRFHELPEAETHLHADSTTAIGKLLLTNLQSADLSLMNGLRGGLILPAWDMQVEGLQPKALMQAWQARGADVAVWAQSSAYWAYELGGYFAFSTQPNDAATMQGLRARVKFLQEDAPALKHVLNPDGKIITTNLKELLKASTVQQGSITQLTPLFKAGKGLTRTPGVLVKLNNGHQHIFLQLLADQRLDHSAAMVPYARFTDPVMVQLVLNLLRVE